MKTILTGFFITVASWATAQEAMVPVGPNLIINGGFEEIDSCLGVVELAPPWTSGLPSYLSSSDLQHDCILPRWGYKFPHGRWGKGNAAIATLVKAFKCNYQEYLVQPFQVALEKDSIYQIGFFASQKINTRPKVGIAFSNGIGLLISKEAPEITILQNWKSTLLPESTYLHPHVLDTNWTEISYLFKATGEERFLTIGGFLKDSEFLVIPFPGEENDPNQAVCTFVDSVFLYKLRKNTIKSPECPNTFSPNGDGQNDQFFIAHLPEGSTLSVYNRWGVQVYQASPYTNNWAGQSNQEQDLPEGVYFVEVQYLDGTGALQSLRKSVHLFR
jgi:gliding motility-associated-like protein